MKSHLSPFCEQIELLKTIPGVNQRVAEVIVAEIGVDMSRFATHRKLASWAGLCPGNYQSAGKRKSGKTRKGDRWLSRALVEASWAASRAKGTYLQSQYYRLLPRKGKKKTAVAVAHTILVIIYHILAEKVAYRELGQDYLDAVNRTAITRHHVKRLQSLGYNVTLQDTEAAA